MNKRDFVETVNIGHEAFLKKLSLHDARDSDFPYWLSSAALNLCLNSELRDKLKYVDDLHQVVKHSFELLKDVSDSLSEEERERLEYCQALFKQTFERVRIEKLSMKTKHDSQVDGDVISGGES